MRGAGGTSTGKAITAESGEMISRKQTHRIGLAVLGLCALAGTPDTTEYEEMPASDLAYCEAAAAKIVDGKIIWLQARQPKVEKAR